MAVSALPAEYLDGVLLQVVVVHVGTNNYGHSAEQVTGGLLEIVRTINERQPQAQVIVIVSATTPRRASFTHSSTDARAHVRTCARAHALTYSAGDFVPRKTSSMHLISETMSNR